MYCLTRRELNKDMERPWRKAYPDFRQPLPLPERTQTLGRIVRLLDMLHLIGCIEWDVDIIELEILGGNACKKWHVLLLDFLLQVAYGPILIDIDWEGIFIIRKGKEAVDDVHL